MKKLVALFAAAAVLATVGLAATASAKPGHRDRHHDGHHDRAPRIEMFDELGVDAKQRASIQQVLEGTRTHLEALRTEKQKVGGELRALLETDRPDQAKVLGYVEALGNLETEMDKARMTSKLQVAQLLTPEQRAKMKELRKDFRGHKGMKGKRGKRGRHGKFDGARFEAVKTACEADVAKLCPGLEGREAFKCMKEKRDQVSAPCKDAFEAARKDFKGRRGGGGEGKRQHL